ncbi:MAG: hypothetical protein AAF533_12135 [Acidobacteriota bacterium]
MQPRQPPHASLLRVRVLLASALLALVVQPVTATDDPSDGLILHPAVIFDGLNRMAANDLLGRGEEARRLRTTCLGRLPAVLAADRPRIRLSDDSEHALSPELAEALRNLDSFTRRSFERQVAPVKPAALEKAFAKPESQAAVAALFARSLELSTQVDDQIFPPELGGLAVLTDGRVELLEMEDPTRPALAALSAASRSPQELAEAWPRLEGLPLLDPHGLLERTMHLSIQREERGVPRERWWPAWTGALRAVIENGSNTFVLHPKQELELACGRRWTGQLLGHWHLHPGQPGPDSVAPGAAPSPDDLDIARVQGQFLTLAFLKDGFRVHDLSGVRRGQPVRTYEHRSDAWRRDFAGRIARLRAQRLGED